MRIRLTIFDGSQVVYQISKETCEHRIHRHVMEAMVKFNEFCVGRKLISHTFSIETYELTTEGKN